MHLRLAHFNKIWDIGVAMWHWDLELSLEAIAPKNTRLTGRKCYKTRLWTLVLRPKMHLWSGEPRWGSLQRPRPRKLTGGPWRAPRIPLPLSTFGLKFRGFNGAPSTPMIWALGMGSWGLAHKPLQWLVHTGDSLSPRAGDILSL